MIDEPIQAHVEDVHPHPVKTGHRAIDLTIALCAIAISVISLVIGIEHGRTEQRLVAASSWPFLEMRRDDILESGHRVITFRLVNAGIGPAQVQGLTASLDKVRIRSLTDLLSSCCGVAQVNEEGLDRLGVELTGDPITVLPARGSFVFLRWRQTRESPDLWTKLAPALKRIQWRSCYCSALEDCWTTSLSHGSRPTKVDVCRNTSEEFSAAT